MIMVRKGTLRRWIAATLLLALTGCGETVEELPSGVEGGPCPTAGDCDPGLTCVSSRCVQLPDGGPPPPCPDSAPAPAPDQQAAISLKVQRYVQAGAMDCGPTSLRMVLHFLGGTESHADVMKHFTILPGIGVFDSHIGSAAIDLGYTPKIITFNFRVLHPAWISLSGDQLLVKLQSYLPKITDPTDKLSVQGYIEYLKKKGAVTFQPISRELLISQLAQGLPVIAAVDLEYLYDGKSSLDPFKPTHWTHAIVVHGYDPQTDAFEIADPWYHIALPNENGRYFVSAPKLITAILLGFQVNDGWLVVVEKKS